VQRVPGDDGLVDRAEPGVTDLLGGGDHQLVAHRHGLDDVHLVVCQQVEQRGAAGGAVGVDQHDAPAVPQRRPDLQQAQVEAQRRVVQHPPARTEPELGARPVGEPVDRAHGQRDDLRDARRPGRGEQERHVLAGRGGQLLTLGSDVDIEELVRQTGAVAVGADLRGGHDVRAARPSVQLLQGRHRQGRRGQQEPPARGEAAEDQGDRFRRLLRHYSERAGRQRGDAGSGRPGHGRQLGIADLAVAPDQCGRVSSSARVFEHGVDQLTS
jgi:hypothetical protein